MAQAFRMTGKNLKVLWIDGSGTVDLTGDQRAFSVTREQETADVTAGADGFRNFKATVKNFTASLEVLMTGSAGTATMNRVDIGKEGTILWGEEGTAAGKPKWGYTAIVTNNSQTLNFDDAAVVNVEFQGQGVESFNGNSAVWP